MNLRTSKRMKIIFLSLLVILTLYMIIQLFIYPSYNYEIRYISPSKSRICNQLKKNDNCLPLFRNFDSKYRISPFHNLIYCVIEKNLSTLFVAIVCLLFDKRKFMASGLSVTDNLYEKRICKGLNEYKSVSSVASTYNIDKFHFLLVSRDPIERFVSGFVDKCILETKRNNHATSKCYGCHDNVTCVVEELTERAKIFAANGGEFSYEDIHLFPQNWHCNLREHFERYHVLKYNEDDSVLIRQILDLFREIGVDMDIVHKVIYDLRYEKKTPHTTRGTPERSKVLKEIFSNKQLLKKIVSLFYYDYVLFGYKIPDIE
uniref:Sulfotransferase domain-containing protein n=1 Tax=Strongyloides stercoralis TaxID=6248 RepID=A0A0K0E9J0_STRER